LGDHRKGGRGLLISDSKKKKKKTKSKDLPAKRKELPGDLKTKTLEDNLGRHFGRRLYEEKTRGRISRCREKGG